MEIRLLQEKELPSIFPLIRQLNPSLSEQTFLLRLQEMISQGYKCVAVFDKGEVIAISGIWIQTRFYVGHFIEPDNVIVQPNYQGKEIGKQLLHWILEYGKANGCDASELNCYVNNGEGQKFWFNQGYTVLGFHFQQKIH